MKAAVARWLRKPAKNHGWALVGDGEEA